MLHVIYYKVKRESLSEKKVATHARRKAKSSHYLREARSTHDVKKDVERQEVVTVHIQEI